MIEDPLESLTELLAPLTPRGRAVLLLAMILIIAGVLSKNQLGLVYLTTGMGIALLVFIERQVFISRLSAASRMTIERRIDEPLIEGERTKARIILRNNTPIPIEHLELYDDPPRLFKTEKPPAAALALPAYGEAIIEYDVKLVVGKHEWSPPRIVVGDFLGFFRSEVFHGQRALVIRVQPRVLELSRKTLALPAVLQPGGISKARRKGVGTEFLELREYVPGDEPRFIDWKAFARTRKLMVKVFEQESVLRAVIVLDAWPTMFRGVIGETKIEYSARLAIALAEYFARRGDTYRLYYVAPDDSIAYTSWLRGRASSTAARYFLAENIEWSNIDYAIGSYAPSIRARKLQSTLVRTLPRSNTIVFIITDLGEKKASAKEYGDYLGKLIAMHNTLFALVPLTTFFEIKTLQGMSAALYRILSYRDMVYYMDMLKLLRRAGIYAVAMGPMDLLSYVLTKIEHLRGMSV